MPLSVICCQLPLRFLYSQVALRTRFQLSSRRKRRLIFMVVLKATILGIIEDYLDQTDLNVTIWHARMDATPSASAALSRRGETSSGSSPHWTTHLYGVCAIVWGLHGLVMQQAAHRLNVAKWDEEKREKAAKAAAERTLRHEVEELRGHVSALENRIVSVEAANAKLESKNAKLEREVTALQKVVLD
ncbi:hypothetical protein PENNAL_c0058G07263 [Penicillium nalgiovense]|uniref:Uncharacterized protein n=1 Tax=Penicillium nalgiovense TaxID=60175 RepID=A0A1V6XRW5_PENNA|nr:hypothetical protein PENNAL_c0058G07263 [Penicillium nalgiovense]